MQKYRIGLSSIVCANLYVQAESEEDALALAEIYIKNEEESETIYLDEDRWIDDPWQVDSIQPIGD